MKKQPRQPKSNRPDRNASTAPADAKPKRSALEIEALEPRILLSATWTGTEGDDSHDAGNQGDEMHGLGGNDTLHGGTGGDLIDGGTGNDQLFGEQGADTLIGGGGNDVMDGGTGADTFRVTGAQHGDVITVVGGNGPDTIDLSEYAANQVTDTGSQITVNLGGGQSFTINHTEVETVVTGAAVNTAPTATDGSATINEDAAASVVTLAGTDPDTGDAVDHYVVDSTPDHGTLMLNGSAVSAGDSISQADIAAGHLTFQPDANWNGDTSFGFHAHDGDALSANAGTFSIHVDAVNDAASASNGSVTVGENAPATISLSGTDPDAGDAVDQYRVESLPDHGTLMLNGNAVNAGDVISQADISAGQLTFQPDAGWNGSTSLSFRASDGDAWSAGAANFDINVSSVNDAPITGGGSLAMNEDGAASPITLSGTDPDTGDAVTQYRIESLPNNGTLTLNGAPVSANDVVTQAQIDGGQLTFQPNADWNGSTSFSYRAHDGDVFADNAGTFNITVNAVNDGPSALNGNLTLNEDAAASVVTLAGTDPDTGDAVDHYVVDSTPDHGTLMLNGSAVIAGDSISQADIAAGHLTFQPDANWNGDTSFGFHAHDGDALSANAGTFSIHVDAVNDAAGVNAGADVSADEGSTVNLSATAGDVDGDGLTYTWTQTGGPSVSLGSANGATPNFVAPDVDSPTTLTFQVQVSDGHEVTTDTVSVLVNPVAAASGGGGSPPPVVVSDPTPPVVTPPADPIAEVPSDPPPVETPADPIAEAPVDPAPPEPVAEAPPVTAPPVVSAPPVDSEVHTPPVIDDVPAATPDTPTINVITPPVSHSPMSSVVDLDAPVIGASPSPAQPAFPSVPTDGTPSVNQPAPVADGEPAPTVNSSADSAPNPQSSDDRVIWDGREDMRMMDPRAEFGDTLDDGTSFADDSNDSPLGETPVPFSNAIESQFSVTQVVTLPTFALTGSAPAGLASTMPGAGQGSAGDDFIAEGDSAAARRWAARYSDDQAGLSNSWFDDQHDEAKGSPDDSGVYAQAETGGFFARLWGAVRGLGAASSRNASDERENKRG